MDGHGKFGEHGRSARVAPSAVESFRSFLALKKGLIKIVSGLPLR